MIAYASQKKNADSSQGRGQGEFSEHLKAWVGNILPLYLSPDNDSAGPKGHNRSAVGLNRMAFL